MQPQKPSPDGSKDDLPSGKPLLFAAAVLVVAAAGVLVVLLQRAGGDPARATSTEAVSPSSVAPPVPVAPSLLSGTVAPSPAPPPAPAPAPVASTSPSPPIDLLAGPLPDVLEVGKTVTARGAPLAAARLKELYDYGKSHPGDARPHLLMGADSMNRGWLGFAADHYVRAVKEDPRARTDPRVLADLVKVAGDKEYAKRGAAAIAEIFGESGIPALENAITEAGATGDTARVDLLGNAVRAIGSKN